MWVKNSILPVPASLCAWLAGCYLFIRAVWIVWLTMAELELKLQAVIDAF